MNPLAPGAYTVIVTAVGYAPAASSAIVTASGRAEVGTVTLARQSGAELPSPGPWTVDPAHSTVGAVAQHLGISSVHGRFTDFAATVEIAPDDVTKSRVEAVIRASSIDTGNAMRDGHHRVRCRSLDGSWRTGSARSRTAGRPGPRLPRHRLRPMGWDPGRVPRDG